MFRAGHSSSRAALRYLHAVEERNRAIAEGLDELVNDSRRKAAKKRRKRGRRGREAGWGVARMWHARL